MKPPTFEELLKELNRFDSFGSRRDSWQRDVLVGRLLDFAHAGGYTAIFRAWRAVPPGSEIEDTLLRLANLLDGAAVPTAGREGTKP